MMCLIFAPCADAGSLLCDFSASRSDAAVRGAGERQRTGMPLKCSECFEKETAEAVGSVKGNGIVLWVPWVPWVPGCCGAVMPVAGGSDNETPA